MIFSDPVAGTETMRHYDETHRAAPIFRGASGTRHNRRRLRRPHRPKHVLATDRSPLLLRSTFFRLCYLVMIKKAYTNSTSKKEFKNEI